MRICEVNGAEMTTKTKLKRSPGRLNKTDARGIVQINVRLVDNRGHFVVGNRGRCINIADARVSEVFAEIKRMLDE